MNMIPKNLHGECDKDMAKYNDRPELKNIMLRYKEVFGPLPPWHRLPIGTNAPRAQRGMEDRPPQR